MEFDLKNLKLIGQGGQAIIYDIGNNKILRISRRTQDKDLLKNELSTMNYLKNTGISVPKVYEYLEVDEKPAMIMEKIIGESMLTYCLKNPLSMNKEINLLINLHIKLGVLQAPSNLVSIKERMRFLVGKCEHFDNELKNFIFSIVETLPDNNFICHGDFHPGNILKTKNENYIIDWSGATSGDILSDMARSYLLMKTAPAFPGISKLKHKLMKMYGAISAKKYFKQLDCSIKFNKKDFSKWLVLDAAERSTIFCFPSEKESLINFVKKCYENNKKGIDASFWYLEL